MGILSFSLHTSHIDSLHSINVCTASIARKLSSTGIVARFLFPTGFEKRMLGAMTVARLCTSILLPDSSSTVEKDAAQLRNANKIS